MAEMSDTRIRDAAQRIQTPRESDQTASRLSDEKREAIGDALHNALCDCRDRGTGFVLREADARKAADALAPLLAGWLAEARAEALDVAAALLGRVVDYWDGRPTQHHGHHIEADLRDVLRAIERDRDHNRAALDADAAETTGGGA